MSGTKPTVFPEFARLDLNNGPGGNANVVEPSAGKKDSGWDVGERPARETFNWLHRITNQWLEYIDECLDTLIADASVTSNFAQDIAGTSGLNFSVNPGIFVRRGVPVEIATSTLLNLPPNDTSFVYLNTTTGTINFNAGASPYDAATLPFLVALFEVTTDATTITNVTDVRSYINLPDMFTVVHRDSRTAFSAGISTNAVEITPTDTTPTQDLALGNSFFWRADSAVSNFTFQDPVNTNHNGSSVSSPVMTLVILLDNTGQTGSFSGKYRFVNQPGGTYVIDGNNALEYIISGVYDPVQDLWWCTVTPQAV